MSLFAKIENNIVTNVIVAEQSFIDSGAVEGFWLETTANALNGVVYELDLDDIAEIRANGMSYGPIPTATDKPCVRKNQAGIGYNYDPVEDAFYPPTNTSLEVDGSDNTINNEPIIVA